MSTPTSVRNLHLNPNMKADKALVRTAANCEQPLRGVGMLTAPVPRLACAGKFAANRFATATPPWYSRKTRSRNQLRQGTPQRNRAAAEQAGLTSQPG